MHGKMAFSDTVEIYLFVQCKRNLIWRLAHHHRRSVASLRPYKCLFDVSMQLWHRQVAACIKNLL